MGAGRAAGVGKATVVCAIMFVAHCCFVEVQGIECRAEKVLSGFTMVIGSYMGGGSRGESTREPCNWGTLGKLRNNGDY